MAIECNKCGACCKQHLQLLGTRPDDGMILLLELRGGKVFKLRNEWWLELPVRCSKLNPDNTCSIYESRPNTCREYPKFVANELLPDECSFKRR